MAFKIAASLAFREAAKKAKPVLLEPIFKIEVTAPEDYMGDIIGDISSRRGRIEGTDLFSGAVAVRGFVPLAEMFGYATDLRSRTQGRGVYVMQFDHFEKLPDSLLEKINK
jgi:elongation factor G